MQRIIFHCIGVALALLFCAYIVPGIHVENFYTALLVAFLLGILNVVVRPILVLLTLPVTVLTFGLFVYVINAALFLFVSSFIDGFTVSGWLAALVGSLIVSTTSWLIHKLP